MKFKFISAATKTKLKGLIEEILSGLTGTERAAASSDIEKALNKIKNKHKINAEAKVASVGMEFIRAGRDSETIRYPEVEPGSEKGVSIDIIEEAGYKKFTGDIWSDGNVAYFLVKKDGETKWLVLGLD